MRLHDQNDGRKHTVSSKIRGELWLQKGARDLTMLR